MPIDNSAMHICYDIGVHFFSFSVGELIEIASMGEMGVSSKITISYIENSIYGSLLSKMEPVPISKSMFLFCYCIYCDIFARSIAMFVLMSWQKLKQNSAHTPATRKNKVKSH